MSFRECEFFEPQSTSLLSILQNVSYIRNSFMPNQLLVAMNISYPFLSHAVHWFWAYKQFNDNSSFGTPDTFSVKMFSIL